MVGRTIGGAHPQGEGGGVDLEVKPACITVPTWALTDHVPLERAFVSQVFAVHGTLPISQGD